MSQNKIAREKHRGVNYTNDAWITAETTQTYDI